MLGLAVTQPLANAEGATPVPEPAPDAQLLDEVIVTAKPLAPAADENFKAARDLVAGFGAKPRASTTSTVLSALGQRFSLLPTAPPQASSDSADRADAAAQRSTLSITNKPGQQP